MSWTGKVLILLVAAAVFQGFLLLHKEGSSPRAAMVGDVLPPLDLERREIRLRLDAKDQSACTYIIFFSPSCPTSARLVPQWNLELRQAGMPPTMGIAYASSEETEEFISEYHLSFPVLSTGAGGRHAIASRSGIFFVPQIIILQERGRIAAIGDSRSTLSALTNEAGCIDGELIQE